ncbi:MAG: chromate resistance protein ChrB domain-containing protein [Steroidobacteraceae bacterium]
MTAKTAAWLLLVTNLPGRNATLRMRLWRALKAAGVGLLRDGAYVLPNSAAAREILNAQAQEIKAAGGAVHILTFDADSPQQNSVLTQLFDRSAEYAEVVRTLDAFKRELSKLKELEARQRIAAISREVATIAARDFFSGAALKQVEGVLADVEGALNRRFSPDEPHSAHQRILIRDRKSYRARTWATREHLWIDRVASAWLIRRFIDPKAKFVWLKSVKDCPKRAVGFDFDGAEFTHVDSKVTFEVMIVSFQLQDDIGLAKLGKLVHQLDVGGLAVAEAPGFATIMAGARTLKADDDGLLEMMTLVLDGLYAGYSNASKN